MSSLISGRAELEPSAFQYIMAALFGACLFAGIACAADSTLSEQYAMEIDPAAKQQLGEERFGEVMAFFHAAEKAIETKDLDALMSLYSEDYTNGGHDKQSVRRIWKRIFSTFDTMATHHIMQLTRMTAVTKSASENTVIFRCTGLLMGVHDSGKGAVTIDNWTQQDHVLVKQDGKWQLIGTYGRNRKRLWFDKPIHPLF
ncbi:MAG: nuclear transport factor 2 family protein [Mariprofundaceae bacterium]